MVVLSRYIYINNKDKNKIKSFLNVLNVYSTLFNNIKL